MPLPKRIVYIPGIISLMALPILIIVYVQQYYQINRQPALTLAIEGDTGCYSEDNSNKSEDIYIYLTGNNTHDKLEIEASRTLIKKIFSNEDSTHIVHYKFSNAATYSTLLEVCTLFEQEEITSYYMTKDGDEIVFPESPRSAAARYYSRFLPNEPTRIVTGYSSTTTKSTILITIACFLILTIFTIHSHVKKRKLNRKGISQRP